MNDDFSTLLRQWRARKGMSQEDLARTVGCNRKTIIAWESGVRLPRTAADLKALSEALELTSSEEEHLLVVVNYYRYLRQEAIVHKHDSLRQGSEWVASFSLTSWPPANVLDTPLSIVDLWDTFPNKSLSFGPITLNEVALILRPLPGTIWKSDSIAWCYSPTEFKMHSFWSEFEISNGISKKFDISDQTIGKHIRLTAAGLMRHPETYQLGFVWQRISWEQSRRTNGYVAQNTSYNGFPIWCWFREKDLLTPSLESDDDRRDPPLANRFAINLAVILKNTSGREYVIIQNRSSDMVVGSERVEIGISESIHGDRGWPLGESDIVDGNPNLLRTAQRCLWQELGLAEEERTYATLPGFQFDLSFTALVLNKQELQARLVGFVIVHGEIPMFEESNRRSLEEKIVHKDFGSRMVKDAIEWKNIHMVDATSSGLAWILKQTTLGPEDRIRLVLFLEHRFGVKKAVKEFADSFDSAEQPSWWPKFK